MNRTQCPVPSTLSLAIAAPSGAALDIVATPAIASVVDPVLFGHGPLPCRCGHYLSEDFNGHLFCRGCAGTDPADITPRLPLCHPSR